MNKQLGFLLIALLFNGSQSAVICPPATAYSPCSCDEYKGNSATIELNCGGKNVDDTRMSAILDALLTTGGATPVASFNLWTNKLTRVPSQLPRFTQLVSVDLNSNTIRSLPTGAFMFPAAKEVVRSNALHKMDSIPIPSRVQVITSALMALLTLS